MNSRHKRGAISDADPHKSTDRQEMNTQLSCQTASGYLERRPLGICRNVSLSGSLARTNTTGAPCQPNRELLN